MPRSRLHATANIRCGTIYTPLRRRCFRSPLRSSRCEETVCICSAAPALLSAEPGRRRAVRMAVVGSIGRDDAGAQSADQAASVEKMSLQASVAGINGSTMGVGIDVDGFDPGDGLGRCSHRDAAHIRDIYTGQSSVGVRFANINPNNVEFGVIESSIINWVYGPVQISASNIGLLDQFGQQSRHPVRRFDHHRQHRAMEQQSPASPRFKPSSARKMESAVYIGGRFWPSHDYRYGAQRSIWPLHLQRLHRRSDRDPTHADRQYALPT